MRLVEAVARKFFHQIEYGFGPRLHHAASHRAVNEDAALLGHLFRLLLAHGAPQQIGATQRIAGQHLRDLHHLFLVENDAVGRRQYGLQIRMQIVDGPVTAVVLAGDEVIDHPRLQRARPEQRHQRDDVFEAIGLQAPDQVFHATRFELEYRGRAAAFQQRKGCGIVHFQAQ